jgi:MoaA/NifB/PqqE/SkfB family radical SAM enzyme
MSIEEHQRWEAFQAQAVQRDPYFSRLGMILTDRCNIRCSHCIFDCRTSRGPSSDLAVIEGLIAAAAASQRVTLIGFTGGEPFLELSRLVRLTALAVGHGLKAGVTTNGYWGTTAAAAAARLSKLPGLTVLAVSTDQFHQQFVPVHRVRNIIRACSQVGVRCHVRVSFLKDRHGEIEAVKAQLAEVDGLYEMQTQPVVPAGRASSEIGNEDLFAYDASFMPCQSADRPTMRWDGDVFACCGPAVGWPRPHPLWLGNARVRPLDHIIRDAETSPVVHAIRLWGPSELLRFIERQAACEGRRFALPPPSAFPEMCSLCRFVLTDPDCVELLQRAVATPDVYHEVATARLIDFAEPSMLLAEPDRAADTAPPFPA